MKDASLKALTDLWLVAKADEKEANARRLKVEETLVAYYKPNKQGKSTFTLNDGTKIGIEISESFKANYASLTTETAEWADDFKVIRYKETLNEPRIKKIREMRPDLWRKLAKHITTKAAKPAISIDLPETDDGV